MFVNSGHEERRVSLKLYLINDDLFKWQGNIKDDFLQIPFEEKYFSLTHPFNTSISWYVNKINLTNGYHRKGYILVILFV